MILRPPPVAAGTYPPGAPAPLLALPLARPSAIPLTEEEFYREKQRLKSLERNLQTLEHK